MIINEKLVKNSNLRGNTDAHPNIYDSIRVRQKTVKLDFEIRFDYENDYPCRVIFSSGQTIYFQYIHRIQQFIAAVTGEELKIKLG